MKSHLTHLDLLLPPDVNILPPTVLFLPAELRISTDKHPPEATFYSALAAVMQGICLPTSELSSPYDLSEETAESKSSAGVPYNDEHTPGGSQSIRISSRSDGQVSGPVLQLSNTQNPSDQAVAATLLFRGEATECGSLEWSARPSRCQSAGTGRCHRCARQCRLLLAFLVFSTLSAVSCSHCLCLVMLVMATSGNRFSASSLVEGRILCTSSDACANQRDRFLA